MGLQHVMFSSYVAFLLPHKPARAITGISFRGTPDSPRFPVG